jgi:hypothetical protein
MKGLNMSSIDVFIQGEGLGDILVAPAEPHHRVADLIGGLKRPPTEQEELLIFVEDATWPIEADAVIEELVPLDIWNATIPSPLRLHMSRCRHVDVSVSFNGELAKRRFSPSATIARVHHWAARRAFEMAPRDAAEHVLQLQNSTTRPDRDVHIGTLTAGKACCVSFDLVPRKRVEG